MSACSLSGVVPEEPVVSLKSGHVFEKRLILKHIKQTGTCPITNADLGAEDLLDVKASQAVRPRAPSATSFPSLLSTFQNEWDATMLEMFQLKQHLQTVRQELAHALYQHDAACRVIVRLTQERDAARAALTNTQQNVAGAAAKAGAGAAGDDDKAEIAEIMKATSKELSVGRKKRTKEAQSKVTRREVLRKYGVAASHPLHGATKPGILCLDIHPTDETKVVTGGVDGNAIVFNRKAGKILATLKGHKKRVNQVAFHPTQNVVFTASADNTAAIWTADSAGKYSSNMLSQHTDEVVGLSLHPSGRYMVTASKDKSWNFWDVGTGQCKQTVADQKMSSGYSRVSFHPDGEILSVATDVVRIFDVRSAQNVATFKAHVGSITGLSFSQNGFYLASSDENGTVKMWDLRKLENFYTIQEKDMSTISNISFDRSGAYLGVVGENVRVYQTKGWGLVNTWKDHKAPVTDIRFGNQCSFFATVSKDRTLKIFED